MPACHDLARVEECRVKVANVPGRAVIYGHR
jgi:hypothetical protein